MPRVKTTAKRIVDPQSDSQEESYNPANDGRKRTVVSRGGAAKRGRIDTAGVSGSRGGAALGRGKGKGHARPPTPRDETSSEEEEVSAAGTGSVLGSDTGSDDEATDLELEIQQPGQQAAPQ